MKAPGLHLSVGISDSEDGRGDALLPFNHSRSPLASHCQARVLGGDHPTTTIASSSLGNLVGLLCRLCSVALHNDTSTLTQVRIDQHALTGPDTPRPEITRRSSGADN